MSKNINTQLKELRNIAQYVRPEQDWVVSNKQTLMRQIENSTPAEIKPAGVLSFLEYWMPRSKFMLPLRFALVLLIIMGVTVSSWIAGVSASNASLPGQVLYKVKIATENTQLALTSALSGDDKAENTAKLQLQFAQRRSQEVKQLVAQQTPESTGHVPETIQKLKETIQDAQDNLKEVKKDTPESILTLAKDVSQQTSAIAQDLKEVTDQSPAQNAEIVKQVVETSKIVNDTGLQAIEVVLQDNTVVEASSGQEIKDLVQEKVGILVKNIEDSKVAVEEVKQLSAVATSTIQAFLPTSTLPLSTSTKEKIATSTLPLIPTEEVKKAGESIQKADKVAGEVQLLLDGNQVKEAIEKAKTLNDLTTQTQQAVVDSKAKVNAVLPLMIVPTTTLPGLSSSTLKILSK